ncbi:MAG: glycosyltransferase family 2 protein [Chloroflexi bacterium]|nr:glycosyltransferase family 2 protein [Chloroflexota bacterium]
MSKRPYLTIVLPMYNEAESIAELLSSLTDSMARTLPKMSYEIIIVDDGSDDGSLAQVRSLAYPNMIIVQHPYNIGNGAAVKSGIRRAKGEFILMMDADGQHKPADIPRLLEHIGRYDMVVGARTRASATAVHRDLANTIYNTFASYICGRKIEDLTSGFRIIRADIAKSLVYLLPNTFSYPTTMTLAVVRGGHSLQYIPITTQKRIGKSKIKLLRDGSRFLMIILKIATLYSPLRIFIPVSLLIFLIGFLYGAFKVIFLNTRYGPTSAMLMTVSIVIFMVGLVSEQVAQLRYERSELFHYNLQDRQSK